MACTLNTGRKLPCKSAFGGIKTVWFGDFGGITGVTVDSITKQVTTISGTQPDWYQFDVKGNSSLETTVTSSRENGTTFYTQTLNLTLTYLDAKTQAELQEIAVARPYVVVEDYYGNQFLCGLGNGICFRNCSFWSCCRRFIRIYFSNGRARRISSLLFRFRINYC
jgi:hypothetical protein